MTTPASSIFTTNDLIQIFLPALQYGISNFFQSAPIPGSVWAGPVTVKQMFQPTMQGVNTGPTIYFYKVGDHRYGFLGRHDKWDVPTSTMYHTENQLYETTFQISAWVINDPNLPNSYTASDLVTGAAMVMQSDYMANILNTAGVGILRITEQRNLQFIDDRGYYEQSPSFDFTLTYTQSIVTTTPVIASTTFDIYPV